MAADRVLPAPAALALPCSPRECSAYQWQTHTPQSAGSRSRHWRPAGGARRVQQRGVLRAGDSQGSNQMDAATSI